MKPIKRTISQQRKIAEAMQKIPYKPTESERYIHDLIDRIKKDKHE